MGGGTGRKTADGKLDHGGRWRVEPEWPLTRAIPATYYFHSDGSLRSDVPVVSDAARQFTYDPSHPVPTIGGLFSAVAELPDGGPGIEPMWARLLNPMLRLRNIMTPGSADQKESPRESLRHVSPIQDSRPDLMFSCTRLSS